MRDAWEDFLVEPTGRNYLRVRQRILRYRRRPDMAELERLANWFQAGQFATLIKEAYKLLPRWSLCPRLYRLTGLSYWELGKQHESHVDRFLYESCLLGILATGDGSQERPFFVTYPCDPDEVLDHLRSPLVSRAWCRGVAGAGEVVQSSDGRQWWFTYAPAELRKLRRVGVRRRAAASS